MLCLAATPLLARAGPDGFAGRRLEDALRLLQARGLRIVFSSELVTAAMRVASEPRSNAPMEQLREMLEPQGLIAEPGPGGVLQVVRRQAPGREKTRTAPPPARAAPRGDHDARSSFEPAYREALTVKALADPGDIVAAGRQLRPDQLHALGGRIADDPVRLVQSLPGVAASDDFRSEYSVRGSAHRHAAVVIDGVAAPWLQHTAAGRGDTGSLTMLSGEVVQSATLLVGAYPRKDGGQIGPQLDLTLREGARAARAVRASVSRATSMLATEGPLGAEARGSWIVSLRKSHIEWPVGRDDHETAVFGFTDLQSKLVYDVRPGQQVSLSVVAGVSNIDRDGADPTALAAGRNAAGLVSIAWRSLLAPRTVVTQRFSGVTHDFLNRDVASRPVSRGSDRAAAYRVDLTRAALGGVFEAGGQLRRTRGTRRGMMPGVVASGAGIEPAAETLEASWLERSGHASFRVIPGEGVALVAGLRVADSTLINRTAVDRWLQAEWKAGPDWLLHGSAGTVQQFEALDHLRGWSGTPGLRPERATHVDAGAARRLPGSLRFDLTAFARRERDTLREPLALLPDVGPGSSDPGRESGPLSIPRFENALSGSANGVELTLQRTHRRLSGWIGYSYGVARYVDGARGETFDADHDQRHAVNVSMTAALPGSTTLGAIFRGGTNFPVPGYFVARDGRLFLGDRRNQTRLPAYARLDVRAERPLQRAGRRFVIFVESLNVLNRCNVGLADGRFLPDTGEAVGVTERLFPRLISGGVRIDF